MKFDITNLELDAVLVALHTAARVNNTTFLDGKIPTLTHRMARELIEEGQATGELKFDRLLGRALHIDLNDDLVDLTRYGINNGRLTGVQALYNLCVTQGQTPILHLDDQEEPVTVTVEWLERYNAIQNDDINFAYPGMHNLVQELGRTKRPDVQSAKATALDDRGMERLEAVFANRKKFLLDAGVKLPLATPEEIADWQRRWDEATPAQREAMLMDDSVRHAYGSQMSEPLTIKEMLKRNSGKLPSRSERLEQALLCDDNSDRELLGRPDRLSMAPRMVGDQLVSIDVVRESAVSDLNDSAE